MGHKVPQQIGYFALKERMFPSMWTHFDFAPAIEFDFVGEVLQPFVFANFQPVHAPKLSRSASQASGKQSKQSRWAGTHKANLGISCATPLQELNEPAGCYCVSHCARPSSGKRASSSRNNFWAFAAAYTSRSRPLAKFLPVLCNN